LPRFHRSPFFWLTVAEVLLFVGQTIRQILSEKEGEKT